MLLPATADDADDDEFDADEEDKDDGGNPNRAILADKSSSSVSLSRFPKSDIPSPGKSIIPLSSSAELRHRVCRSFCFYPSLSRKASFSLFLSRLRERNVKREARGNGDDETHNNTRTQRCAGAFVPLTPYFCLRRIFRSLLFRSVWPLCGVCDESSEFRFRSLKVISIKCFCAPESSFLSKHTSRRTFFARDLNDRRWFPSLNRRCSRKVLSRDRTDADAR